MTGETDLKEIKIAITGGDESTRSSVEKMIDDINLAGLVPLKITLIKPSCIGPLPLILTSTPMGSDYFYHSYELRRLECPLCDAGHIPTSRQMPRPISSIRMIDWGCGIESTRPEDKPKPRPWEGKTYGKKGIAGETGHPKRDRKKKSR